MRSHAPSTDRRYDSFAAVLSSLCLWHCLTLPLMLAVVPALVPFAVLVHGPGWLHWLLLILAVPASGFALWRGFAIHRDYWPTGLAVSGFVLMALGALAHPLGALGALMHQSGTLEAGMTVAGGLVVALAHWRNWAMQRLSAIG